MTVRKYEEELKQVSEKMMTMLRMVETAIQSSVKALETRDKNLALETIAGDKDVDRLEEDIERDCLKILLMEHPVATDFREVSASLKMITDLERIGDQARDICEIMLQFGDEEYIKKLEHIPYMADLAIAMVKDGINSYINKDLVLARSLDKRDDAVDLMFEKVKGELIDRIKDNPSNADQAILFMMIAKYIERIADHAVNIGEWVDYSVTGMHGNS